MAAMYSRRWLLRLGLGGLAMRALPAGFQVDRLRGAMSLDGSRKIVYRADAVVQLFSLTVFSRANVGSGFAALCEQDDDAGRIIRMRFGGGSLPERARGLNRVGYIEEVVRERNGTPHEAAYFGFITSSPEESAEVARKSLEFTGPVLPYVAADAHASGGSALSVLSKLSVPSSLTWAQFSTLSTWIRERFHGSVSETKSIATSPHTFLYAIRRVMQSPHNSVDADYFYNGNAYKMRVDKSHSANMVRYKGEIRNLRTGKLTPFRFWAERNAVLPKRIELQVRSYLKLAFEADPSAVDHS